MCCRTHLSLLLVEIVDDDADEEVEREEGAENDEDHEVQVHVEVDFSDWLLLHLNQKTRGYRGIWMVRPQAVILTPLESTAACIISIHPLNVACHL